MSKNGQQLAKETVVRFDRWVDRMSDEDFTAIVHKGKIKRSEIIKAIHCGRAALSQNKALAEKIKALEDRLRESGVLPPKPSEENSSGSKTFNQSATKQIRQTDHLSRLEEENQLLRAKVGWLEDELRRYEELSESLYELGDLTR